MIGTIAHYKLDDNEATSTVLDVTGLHNGNYKDGSGNINTDTGSSAGKIDSGLSFDGDEYVEIADSAAFSPIFTPFSISAWVNMTSAVNFVIASKFITASNTREWVLTTQAAALLFFQIYDEDNDKNITRAYSVSLAGFQGSLIHIVGTYDGGITDSSIKVYVESVRVDNLNSGSGDFVSCRRTAAKVKIGNTDASFANGIIDNLMIYERDITQQEVNDQFNLYRVARGRDRVRSRGPGRNW